MQMEFSSEEYSAHEFNFFSIVEFSYLKEIMKIPNQLFL